MLHSPIFMKSFPTDMVNTTRARFGGKKSQDFYWTREFDKTGIDMRRTLSTHYIETAVGTSTKRRYIGIQ